MESNVVSPNWGGWRWCVGKAGAFRGRRTWIQTACHPLSNSITLGKALCPSEPWFSHAANGLLPVKFLAEFSTHKSFQQREFTMLMMMHKYRPIFHFLMTLKSTETPRWFQVVLNTCFFVAFSVLNYQWQIVLKWPHPLYDWRENWNNLSTVFCELKTPWISKRWIF